MVQQAFPVERSRVTARPKQAPFSFVFCQPQRSLTRCLTTFSLILVAGSTMLRDGGDVSAGQTHLCQNHPCQTWGCSSMPVASSGGQAAQDEAALKRFEVEKGQMGVKFRMVVYGPDLQVVRPAILSAFKRIQAIEDRLSDYDDQSEAMQLCETAEVGVPVKVSEDLFEILQLSQKIHAFSDGAFDPTIGNLSRLWRKARQSRVFPEPEEVKRELAPTGYDGIRLDSTKQTVTFLRPGIQLDFGGIAKGYAADAAIKVFRQAGFPKCLVDAGGDVTVGDAPPGREGWVVKISDSGPPTKVVLANGSVATSGDRFQFLNHKGKKYSHIIDPRSGYGTTHRHQVTVACFAKKFPGALADAYASAFSVMSEANFVTKLNFSPDVKVRIVQVGRSPDKGSANGAEKKKEGKAAGDETAKEKPKDEKPTERAPAANQRVWKSNNFPATEKN